MALVVLEHHLRRRYLKRKRLALLARIRVTKLCQLGVWALVFGSWPMFAMGARGDFSNLFPFSILFWLGFPTVGVAAALTLRSRPKPSRAREAAHNLAASATVLLALMWLVPPAGEALLFKSLVALCYAGCICGAIEELRTRGWDYAVANRLPVPHWVREHGLTTEPSPPPLPK